MESHDVSLNNLQISFRCADWESSTASHRDTSFGESKSLSKDSCWQGVINSSSACRGTELMGSG